MKHEISVEGAHSTPYVLWSGLVRRVRRAHQFVTMAPPINNAHHFITTATPVGRTRHAHQSQQSGFSYIEVLVATLLISISLVPALESLNSGILSSNLHAETAQQHYRLQSKMEQILAQPFAQLLQQADALVPPAEIIPPPYSDPVATASRRLVRLKRYDADNVDNDNDPFSGTDTGLLWVQVSIDNSPYTLETLIHE